MNAHHDNTAPKGLREWWASPPRSGPRRMLSPWEYRHLRAWAGVRIAGGTAALVFGGIVLSEVPPGRWRLFGAFLLTEAAANYLLACWELSIARAEPAPA